MILGLDDRDPRRADPLTEPAPKSSARLSLAAFVFVVFALIALASMPALLLQRVSRTNAQLTDVLLPAYDAVNEFTVAMEQRTVVARTELMRGERSYGAAYRDAMRRERSALNTLARLAPEVGDTFAADYAELRALVSRRDSLAVLSVVMSGPLSEEMVPRFDALRDSLLLSASRLQADLRQASNARTAEEALWIERQQLLAIALGLVTLFAVVAVGRFAMTQRRLRGNLQKALATADRLRREAEAGRAELLRVTESRTRLLRGFTHDVKNPLGAARGYLDLLLDGIQGPVADAQRRSLERARASVQSALGLVDEMLELARAESGHLEIEREPIDLRELVADVAEESRPLAESKGLAFETHIGDDGITVLTDPRRVRQVIGNLMSNAVKYTDQGSVALRVEHDPDARRAGVSVVDTGRGISREQLPLLFQEFVRLDSGRRTDGAGVGLTISHSIARALGGEIVVESEVGRGSTFTLWLPHDYARD